MSDCHRTARINVKVLVILVVVAGVLLGGAAVGYKVRKRIIADRALAAGQAAFDQKNWGEACKQFKQYISRYPDENPDILARYAEANLAVRPLESENIGAAIGAYRRYLRSSPGEEKASHELADLYLQVRDFSEASYVARERLKKAPEDLKAQLAVARALVGLGQAEEARTQYLEPLVGAHPDQVDAFLLLSEIARQDRAQGPDAALAWLDKAIAANPQSATPLIGRAAFRHERIRELVTSPAPDTQAIQTLDEAVRADLNAVDALQVKDPRVLRAAFDLWLARGEQAKAEAQLRSLESLDEQTHAEFDVDADLAKLLTYTAAGQLALQRDAREEGVALADRACAELSERQKVAFLELAVELYLAGDQLDKARASLDALQKGLERRLPSEPALAERLSVLAAAINVKDAEGNPYDAINRLREVLVANPKSTRAWKLLGRAYLRSGQVLRGLSALEAHVKLVPNDRESLLTLARAYLKFDSRLAAEFASGIERFAPDDLQAKLIRITAALSAARAGVSEADRAQLAQELVALRESHPKVADVRLLQAALAVDDKRPQDAMAELRLAVEECDEKADKATAALQLASLEQVHGDPDKALAAAQKAVELQPDSAGPRIQVARLHEAAGRLDEARKVLDQATVGLKDAEKLQAQFALCRFLLSHEARKEGIALLRAAAATHPHDTQVRLALLGLPEIRENAAEAQQLIDELRKIEGDKGLLWPVEQARLWLVGQPTPQREQEIINLLTPVIEAGSAGPDPVLMLGSLYFFRGDAQKAEETYRRSIDQRPIYIPVVTRLLALLEGQGRFTEASALLDRVPQNLPALSEHRVVGALGRRDMDSAILELQSRTEADPDDAASKVTLARLVYARTKQTNAAGAGDAAFKLLDEAAHLAPDLPELLAARVAILHDQGRQDEALALLDSEVARRNDFTTYDLRASYHALQGHIDLAEQDYRHLTTFKDRAVRGYEALALFYGRLNRVDQAVAAAAEGLKLEPRHLGLQRLIAAALVTAVDLDDRARGRQMVEDLLAREPNDTTILLIKAQALLQSPDANAHQEAAALLERIVSIEPRRARAHLYLVDLAREKGDRTLAMQRVARGLMASPDDADLLLAQAVLEAESNNAAGARETAGRIIERQPRHVPALNLLSSLALRGNDLDSATDYNARARKADPANETAVLVGVGILVAKGQPNEALAAVQAYQQTEGGSKSLNAALALVDIHMQAKRFEDAGLALDKAAKLAPGNPLVLRARLSWLAAQERFDDMVAFMTDPPSNTPNVADLQDLAITMLGTAKQFKQAAVLCRHVLKTDPQRVSTLVALGQISYLNEDMAAAREAYQAALKQAPENPQALNDLAWILGKRLDLAQEGILLADQGVTRYPNHPHLRDTRAAILIRLGRFEEALADLEICLKLVAEDPALRPTRIGALRQLAEVLVKLDRAADARAYYDEILRLDQEHPTLSATDRDEIHKAMESLPKPQV